MDNNFLREVALRAFPQLKTRKDISIDGLKHAIETGNTETAFDIISSSVHIPRDDAGKCAVQSMLLTKTSLSGQPTIIDVLTAKTMPDIRANEIDRLVLLMTALTAGFDALQVQQVTGLAVKKDEKIGIEPVRTNTLLHKLASEYPLFEEEGGYEPLEVILEREFVKRGTQKAMQKLRNDYHILRSASVSEHDIDVNLSIFDCIEESARPRFEAFCARMHEKHIMRKPMADYSVPETSSPVTPAENSYSLALL